MSTNFPKFAEKVLEIAAAVSERSADIYMKLTGSSVPSIEDEELITLDDVEREFPGLVSKYKAAWRSFRPWLLSRMDRFQELVDDSAFLADEKYEEASEIALFAGSDKWDAIDMGLGEVVRGPVESPSVEIIIDLPEFVHELEESIKRMEELCSK